MIFFYVDGVLTVADEAGGLIALGSLASNVQQVGTGCGYLNEDLSNIGHSDQQGMLTSRMGQTFAVEYSPCSSSGAVAPVNYRIEEDSVLHFARIMDVCGDGNAPQVKDIGCWWKTGCCSGAARVLFFCHLFTI